MTESLPTADEFFGKQQLPTADEFFAPKVEAIPGGMGYTFDTGSVPMSSPELDNYISQTTTGRILSAFGQGAEQGWGSEPLGLSDESSEALKKLGVFNDYAKGQTSLIKSANEVIMRPAAAAIEAGWRATQAGVGGVIGGSEQIPGAGPYISTGVQTALDPGFQASIMGAGPVGEIAGASLKAISLAFPRLITPTDLVKAHDLGIIGGDEATWKGTSTSGPVNAQFTDALKAQISDVAKDEGTVSPTDTPQAAAAPAPDIQDSPGSDDSRTACAEACGRNTRHVRHRVPPPVRQSRQRRSAGGSCSDADCRRALSWPPAPNSDRR